VPTISDAARSGAAVAASGAVNIQLPLTLAIVYGLAIVIWYELIRSAVLSRVSKWQNGRDRREASVQPTQEAAMLTDSRPAADEQEAAEESEADPARRYYHLARRTARAERDAAVDAANKAGIQAIERIERLHREIEWALDHEEAERIER
jgi:hypothetical protein